MALPRSSQSCNQQHLAFPDPFTGGESLDQGNVYLPFWFVDLLVKGSIRELQVYLGEESLVLLFRSLVPF